MDHKTQTKIYRLLARAFYLLGVVTLLAGLGLSLFAGPVSASGLDTKKTTSTPKPTNTPLPDYQLNLSHIACVDGKVEIHFVLLNVPSGLTPGNLTYTYSDGSSTHTATIAPGSHTGNVWHYTDYQSPGYYNVTAASVSVGGVTVNLHNPGAYAGSYCVPRPTNTPVQPTPTNTPVQPTPTHTPTPADLTLEAACDGNLYWTVYNANAFPVSFTWQVIAGGSGSGSATAPANGYAYFSTSGGSVTVQLSYMLGGAQRTTQASASCEMPTEEPTPTEVTPTPTTEVTVVPPGDTPTPTEVTPTEATPVTTEVPPVSTETPIIPPTGDQPTATPDPGGQPTPIPTFAPPPPSTSDQTPLLIPVTGADQTPRLPQAAPFLSFLGITFLGLGFVSHGLARRLEHERES